MGGWPRKVDWTRSPMTFGTRQSSRISPATIDTPHHPPESIAGFSVPPPSHSTVLIDSGGAMPAYRWWPRRDPAGLPSPEGHRRSCPIDLRGQPPTLRLSPRPPSAHSADSPPPTRPPLELVGQHHRRIQPKPRIEDRFRPVSKLLSWASPDAAAGSCPRRSSSRERMISAPGTIPRARRSIEERFSRARTVPQRRSN